MYSTSKRDCGERASRTFDWQIMIPGVQREQELSHSYNILATCMCMSHHLSSQKSGMAVLCRTAVPSAKCFKRLIFRAYCCCFTPSQRLAFGARSRSIWAFEMWTGKIWLSPPFYCCKRIISRISTHIAVWGRIIVKARLLLKPVHHKLRIWKQVVRVSPTACSFERLQCTQDVISGIPFFHMYFLQHPPPAPHSLFSLTFQTTCKYTLHLSI